MVLYDQIWSISLLGIKMAVFLCLLIPYARVYALFWSSSGWIPAGCACIGFCFLFCSLCNSIVYLEIFLVIKVHELVNQLIFNAEPRKKKEIGGQTPQ